MSFIDSRTPFTWLAGRAAALIAVGSLLLSACSRSSESDLGPQQIAPNAAYIRLSDPAHQPLGAVERRFRGGLTQDITYRNTTATPGENIIRLIRRSGGGFWGGSDAPRFPASLPDQAARAFPFAAVISEPRFSQNGFGAFGYVIAPGTGRDTCIFAQQDEAGPDGKLDLRIRFCLPDGGEAALLRLVQSLYIRSYDAPIDPNLIRF